MRIRPHVVIGGVSLAAVCTLAIVDVSRSSPGPISGVHSRARDLDDESCSSCHGGWTSSMTASCLDCHEPIAEHMEAGRGLHGVLLPEDVARCAICHSEHHGREFDLVNRQSFAQAGFEQRAEFQHARIGFPMDGKHLELDCTACHANADERLVPEGQHRFLGLDQDCATCHEDAHAGKMGTDCASCHGQASFDQLDSRGHERHLPLVGGHADVECRTCHEAGGVHALELLAVRGGPRPRACLACHESPHETRFVARLASMHETDPARACVVCHEPEHESFDDETIAVTAEQHAASGFALAPPHDAVECDACHAPVGTFDQGYPGRGPDECAACHADPHGGQFTPSSPAPTDCLACHAREGFTPHTFSEERHAEDGMRLTGVHRSTACKACHLVPSEGAARLFRGTPEECAACHSDAHSGFFQVKLAATAEVGRASDCSTCHGTDAFAGRSVQEGFDHELYTGFELRGAHAESACEECHPRTGEPDEHGRTFGRVEAASVTEEGCQSCHVDPHDGAFDQPWLVADLGGRTRCARCHVETSFRAFPNGFDHDRWTGFTLKGRHSEIDCSQCHLPLRGPDANGRTWQHAIGRECSDCHFDPHGGQFEQEGVALRCDRCHASSVSFGDLSFDHEADSRFRPGEAHSEVACSGCHKEVEGSDGRRVVRYRPIPRECTDCHGVEENVLRKKRGRN